MQHDLKVGQISVGHAKVLLSVNDADLQAKLCDYTIKNGLNVRQLEQKVKQLSSKSDPASESKGDSKNITTDNIPEIHKSLCKECARFFKGKISLKRNENGKGSLTINFNSDAEINRFLDALKNS